MGQVRDWGQHGRAVREAWRACALVLLVALGMGLAMGPVPAAHADPSPVSIEVDESITIGDSPEALPPAVVGVDETISVGDSPAALPSVAIVVYEHVAVTDSPVVLPPATVVVTESVVVSDSPTVLPPVVIAVSEAVVVSDVGTVPSADLDVGLAASPTTVAAGALLTYVVTLRNNGPSPATNANGSDAVPGNTTFVSGVGPSGWDCTAPSPGATGTVTCNTPSMAALATAVFTMTVRVNPGVTPGSIITDLVTFSSDRPDSVPGNNSATATTAVIGLADLSVAKTDAPDPVLLGQRLTYTATVTNNGPNRANSVFMTDTLPAGVTFVSASATQGACAQSGGSVTCSLGGMANGTSAMVTVAVTPTVAGAITNTAAVTSSEIDPNAANNTVIATTTVLPAADLAVTKAGSPDPVAAGALITYTLAATNNGPSSAANARLTDTLPLTTTFQSFSAAAGWTWTTPVVGDSGSVACSNPSLAVGATSSFTMTLRVSAGAPGGAIISNLATVSSDTGDPSPSNNAATATSAVTQPSPTLLTLASLSASSGIGSPIRQTLAGAALLAVISGSLALVYRRSRRRSGYPGRRG